MTKDVAAFDREQRLGGQDSLVGTRVENRSTQTARLATGQAVRRELRPVAANLERRRLFKEAVLPDQGKASAILTRTAAVGEEAVFLDAQGVLVLDDFGRVVSPSCH